MRLSEAIRLGAMLKPQGTGAFIYRGKTCALGAALDAVGQLSYEFNSYAQIREHFPLCERFATHPMKRRRWLVDEIVEDLNDAPNRWTREQIADWVESIERELTPEAFTDPQPVHARISD